MKRFTFIATLLVAAVLPVFALAQGKKKGKDAVTTLESTAADYKVLAGMKGVLGKVVAVQPIGDRVQLTLRVEYQVAQPNGNGKAPKNLPNIKKPKQNFRPNNRRPNQNRNNRNRNNRNRNNGNRNNPQQLVREYQQIMRIANPAEKQRRLQQFMAKVNQQNQRAAIQQFQRQQQLARQYQQQLAKKQQQLVKNLQKNRKNPNQNPQGFKMVTFAKEFTLNVAANARVAKKNLPLEFDDKGFIKKYTAAELKKLKDDKLDGFKAKISDVAPNQSVYVYLTKPDGKKKKVAIGDIAGNGGVEASQGPSVSGIMIVSEGNPDAGQQKGRKKKKKN